MVAPDLPGEERSIVGAILGQLIEQSLEFSRQVIVDALAIGNNECVQEDQLFDLGWQMLRYSTDHRAAKTVTNQDHIIQVMLFDVVHHRINVVLMCYASATGPRCMTRERRCISAMSFPNKLAGDTLPGPATMPGSVNHYECLFHNFPFDSDMKPS